MRRKQGFTLIEVFVVLAIIGVLIALIVPAIMAARSRVEEQRAMSVSTPTQTAHMQPDKSLVVMKSWCYATQGQLFLRVSGKLNGQSEIETFGVVNEIVFGRLIPGEETKVALDVGSGDGFTLIINAKL